MGGKQRWPKGERDEGGAAFLFPSPPAKPIFSVSEMDFLRTEDRSCLPAPPNTMHYPVCACTCVCVCVCCGCLTCQWSIVLCADLHSKRSEMGLHPGWLCVNELVPACFCVYQSQVVIISLHLSLYTACVPIKITNWL